MSEIENDMGMSLADIAGLDVSDVEELRSSALPAGLYTFEITKVNFEVRSVKDDTETRYVASVEHKVIEVETIVEKGVTEAEVLGKSYTEQFFIDPAEAQKGIGYLKGFVADIGADNSGPIGGVEGAPEGFLDRLVTHRYKAKIVKKKDRSGEMRSRLQLLPKAKAA